MKITTADLDKRICDYYLEKEGLVVGNTQTFREYLIEGIDEFGIDCPHEKLDKLTAEVLEELMDHIDYLWEK